MRRGEEGRGREEERDVEEEERERGEGNEVQRKRTMCERVAGT